MTANRVPRWLFVLSAVVTLVVLGPPALALALFALALTFKLGLLALKVGAVVFVIAAIVITLRALFGRTPSTPRADRQPSIEELAERLEAQELAQRRALDRQLAEALEPPR